MSEDISRGRFLVGLAGFVGALKAGILPEVEPEEEWKARRDRGLRDKPKYTHNEVSASILGYDWCATTTSMFMYGMHDISRGVR